MSKENLIQMVACLLYAEYNLMQENTPEITNAMVMENAALIMKVPETVEYAEQFWGYQAATMVNMNGQYKGSARR